MKYLIELTGPSGSGKSFLADKISNYFRSKHGFYTIQLSFAAPLKQAIRPLLEDNVTNADISSVLIKLLGHEVYESYNYKITSKAIEDIQLICRESIIPVRRRKLLQYIGTDVIRKMDPDYFADHMAFMIKYLSNNLLTDMLFVIDDMRFPNEDMKRYALNLTKTIIVKIEGESPYDHESESYFDKINADIVLPYRPDPDEAIKLIKQKLKLKY